LPAARATWPGPLAHCVRTLEPRPLARRSQSANRLTSLIARSSAIRVAAGLSATGTKGAERRAAISDVQVGKTVTPQGVAKTVLTREQRLRKTGTWLKGLTPEQREQFILSEKFDNLTDRQQELISDAIAEVDNSEYSTPVADIDLEAEPIDIDSLPEDETEAPGESFEVLEGEDIESIDIDDYEEPEA
jgi:hypothetical protein